MRSSIRSTTSASILASFISNSSPNGAQRRLGQREAEGSAAPRLRVRPHFTSMSNHDPMHDRQPNAGAGIFARAVQAAKDSEQVVGKLAVEADAIVADLIDQALALFAAADIYMRALDL